MLLRLIKAKFDALMKEELVFFNHLVEQLSQLEKNNPVVKPIPTNDLSEDLNFDFQDEGLNEREWQRLLEDIVLKTPKTASSLFFNQLFGGRQPKAMLGDLLAVMLNNSMYTYKVAGIQAKIEKTIIKNVCEQIQYPTTADGTIAPGGSMSNYMGLIMARDAHDPSSREEGVTKKMTLYTSAASHYSLPKNASFSGIGRKQVRYISTNSKGEMNTQHLLECIEEDLKQGFHPFFVNATAGTTVLGAFDPISAISKICKKYKLWLHVDGAYCGAVIFSKKYCSLLEGIELSDSFSFNAHKMLGTPLTCSIVVSKDKKYLSNSFSNEAAYLYQTDSEDFDLGKISLQCGRRNDALKFWTLWKGIGNNGLEELVNHQFYLADIARDYINNHPDYTLYSYPNSISVCFNYQGIPARELCTYLFKEAIAMVGYGTYNDVEFVRLVTVNANNSKEEILNLFQKIEQSALALKVVAN